MAYIKHTMKEVSLETIDGLLTEWQDEIPWLYHAYSSSSSNETITFGLRDPENPETPPSVLPFQAIRNTSGNSFGSFRITSYYNSTNQSYVSYSSEKMFFSIGNNEKAWFDTIYITDNLIAFTTDCATSAERPGYKNIIFVIAKADDRTLCIIPDVSLGATDYYDTSLSGARAISYNTELIIPIPTKDNDYTQTDRLGKKTILVPIILNDPNNMIARDVYAVTGKEYPSYLDVLDISDHHFLTNGRIACQLD